jgi:hypothetical protein
VAGLLAAAAGIGAGALTPPIGQLVDWNAVGSPGMASKPRSAKEPVNVLGVGLDHRHDGHR